MYPYFVVFGRTFATYGVCMAFAIILVCCLSIFRVKRCAASAEDILIVAAMAVGVGLFSAKGLYIIITYPPAIILKRLLAGDHTLLSEGGLVFYGGLFGGILGGWMGSLVAKCSFQELEEVIVPCLPLGHAVGRIGCLFAGCCYGIPYEGFGAIYYPHSVSGVPADQGCFPVQIVEAVGDIAIFFFLLYREKILHRTNSQLLIYLIEYALLRFVLEFFRGDSVRGRFAALSTSQWISLAVLTVGSAYFILRTIREGSDQKRAG